MSGMSRRAITGCVAMVLACTACTRPQAAPEQEGSAATHLRPSSGPLTGDHVRRTVYVPVYSSIYLGHDINKKTVELSATVSVRNTSAQERLVLNAVRYYDSAGKLLREYINGPSELAPLASVEFVIRNQDAAGGPGANFLIEWAGASGITEPVMEAVMLGQSGNAGISFTSPGRTLTPVR